MAILLKTRPVNKDVQMKKLEKIHNDLKNWVDVNHYALQLPNMGVGYVGGEKNEIHTATSSIRDWCNIILQHTEQFKD